MILRFTISTGVSLRFVVVTLASRRTTSPYPRFRFGENLSVTDTLPVHANSGLVDAIVF